MKVWFKNGAGELNFGNKHGNTHGNKRGNQNDGEQSNTVTSDKLGDKLGSMLLGSMVEPHMINQAIYKAIELIQSDEQKKKGLKTHFGVRVKNIDNLSGSYKSKQTGANFSIELDDGTELLAQFLIGADGRGSFVRRSAQIGVDTLDYKQTAICCAIKTQRPHGGCARQVFLPTGPLALLPLADLPDSPQEELGHWQSIVWSMPTNDAQSILDQPKDKLGDELAKQLASASGYELGDVTEIHSIASFPLNAIHANTYTQDHLALIGDAAHGVHPLAGQGLNLGLLDVAELTDALIGEFERSRGAVFASQTALKKYEGARRAHNAAMMHAFSAIGFVFSEQRLPLWSRFEWLRSEVVNRIGKSKELSQFFTSQAAGVGQLSPRWR